MPNFLNDLNENIHFTSFSSNFNYDKVKCFINDYLTYLEFQICYFRSQFDLLYMVTELFFASEMYCLVRLALPFDITKNISFRSILFEF